jgi:hypothetical protein
MKLVHKERERERKREKQALSTVVLTFINDQESFLSFGSECSRWGGEKHL